MLERVHELPESVSVSQHALVQELVHGGALVLNTEAGTQIALDAVALEMWQLLDATTSTEGALRQLLELYEIDEGTLRQDMGELIASLATQGLLEI